MNELQRCSGQYSRPVFHHFKEEVSFLLHTLARFFNVMIRESPRTSFLARCEFRTFIYVIMQLSLTFLKVFVSLLTAIAGLRFYI